jgi:DNA-binding NtrC family response regulator
MARRLLIVDDENDMLDFLERVFRRDFDILRAHSVEEAERFLSDYVFDVVITDRRMPRRGGLELIAILAERQPRAMRVLLSGYADSLLDEQHEHWKLVDAWISKPIDSASLRQTIADALARKATGQESTG